MPLFYSIQDIIGGERQGLKLSNTAMGNFPSLHRRLLYLWKQGHVLLPKISSSYKNNNCCGDI